ncbi:uncharacterized protein [Prorops nasuta]|uniref:uncharacterized protein n=1 Tax=Prorops nasuta TaxID=863751 RepID=UPI0034CF54B5
MINAQKIPVGAINNINTYALGQTNITIQSMYNNFNKVLNCIVIPTITDLLLTEIIPRDLIKIPRNLHLADPEFHLPKPVDLILGSGVTLGLLAIGQIQLGESGGDLYLQKTRLGWVIAGEVLTREQAKNKCYSISLERALTRFWENEEVSADKTVTICEMDCENYFLETVRRGDNGRYTVNLPFRIKLDEIGESYTNAYNRLLSVERKLNRDSNLKAEYTRVLEEYIDLGHMSLVKKPDDTKYYMPHHAVIKENSNTTRVRVVFDASAKTDRGFSLNGILMTGPTIQDKLFLHLLRFRKHKYVLNADIEKMYRQVWVSESDRCYQRILWRQNNKIQTFELKTLTFGVASSPFLAIRTIHKLADDEMVYYTKASKVLKTDLYVDDLLTGVETVQEACSLRDEIIRLLAKGDFNIQQWASNDPKIIKDLPSSAVHKNLIKDNEQTLKTLGLSWNTGNDCIVYYPQPIERLENLTKRKVLSEIAKLYDPLGLLGPIIFYVKVLMQEIWRSNIHWDESVSQVVYTKWVRFIDQWNSLGLISFERYLLADEFEEIQVHGFCDASKQGYGACIYIRSRTSNGTVKIRLYCAKSKVAPLKSLTTPRLELCGALLLAKLFSEVNVILDLPKISKTVLWCDSMIVLHWINTDPHLLKMFVSNRIAIIQELTYQQSWRHIKSEDNPADALS